MIENLKSKKQVTNIKIANKGITLIALVITIIVLLILAGVTIATLTGENGILNQAGKAKDKTTEAESIERVQVEVTGSYGLDGTIDKDQLNKNLKNINGLTYNGNALSDSNKIANLPATVTLNGYDIVIAGNGSVRQVSEVEKAKAKETIFEENTPITDTYGNSVTIPKGFKIASDSATDVTGGIVIEDATYEGTKGSQFVWIPVGDIKYADGMKTITLGRYTFTKNSDGSITTSAYTGSYTEDTESEHTYNNAIAKDIEKFKESTGVDKNGGYYIGRYEARKSSAGNLTVVGTDSVYNSTNQSGAAMASRNMYDDDTLPFTSDLMNSYAWDTAIVFEQAFDNRTEDKKTTPYSKQNSLNTSLATTGTNNLTDTTKQDKICNIWDMASNCWEWTTETYSDSSSPCCYRGGFYNNSGFCTSSRVFNDTSSAYSLYSFRPLLYL